MNIDELNNALDNLKFEYEKLNNKFDQLQDQIIDILNYGEIAVVECDKNLNIISTYGAFDAIFSVLNKSYRKFKEFPKLLNNCINEISPEDIEIETEEPFYKLNIENDLKDFLNSTKKHSTLDIFGKLPPDELYLMQIKLVRAEETIRAYIKVLKSYFFLKKYEQKIQKELNQKDLLINNIINSLSVGITLLDTRNRILLMNQSAKDHHFSDSAKILKSASVEGRLYRDIFTNEQNDDINQRLSYHSKALTRLEPVKYTKKTNEKIVNFEIFPLKSITNLPEYLLILSNVNNEFNTELELKYNKISSIAKMLKTENDNFKERIKELELNQSWFMKKLEESNANNKLLHSSLRQIYGYLEMIPLAIAILELPNMKYEFVNKHFLNLIKSDKKDVLSKKDEQIFPKETVFNLSRSNSELLTSFRSVSINIMEHEGKQFLIKNENNEPKHILRIIYIKEFV